MSRLSAKSDSQANAEALARRRQRYRGYDARHRFAWHANARVAALGRRGETLDWQAIPDGPWTCTYCGIPAESWDHVEPLALGGANSAANLVPSCVPCNKARTAKLFGPSFREVCKRGHPYDDVNTYEHAKGRHCRACHAVIEKARRGRVRAAA